jgi:hypothetical protein
MRLLGVYWDWGDRSIEKIMRDDGQDMRKCEMLMMPRADAMSVDVVVMNRKTNGGRR